MSVWWGDERTTEEDTARVSSAAARASHECGRDSCARSGIPPKVGGRCRSREERVMKPNIGKAERIVRIVVGIGVLSLAFVGPRFSWAYLGLLPLLSGLIGWCPPYALLGISTVRTQK